MNKQTINMIAIGAIVLGVITFVLQFVLTTHHTMERAAGIGWWLLLVIGLALFAWNWQRSRQA